MTKSKADLCETVGCHEPHKSRQLCVNHYCQWWRTWRRDHPDREPRCGICAGPHHGLGFCKHHYHALKRWGDPLYQAPPMPANCAVEDCDGIPRRDGHCTLHHNRILKHGDPHTVAKRGAKPRLVGIPQDVRDLASAYIYSYTTGAERTPAMIAGHILYQRLRKMIHDAEAA